MVKDREVQANAIIARIEEVSQREKDVEDEKKANEDQKTRLLNWHNSLNDDANQITVMQKSLALREASLSRRAKEVKALEAKLAKE